MDVLRRAVPVAAMLSALVLLAGGVTALAPPAAAAGSQASSRWGIQASFPPVPVSVASIACPSTTVCYAVGQASNATGMILSLSSGSRGTPAWVSDVVPADTGALQAIACPSTTSCYAVGDSSNGKTAIFSLAPSSSASRGTPTWVSDVVPADTGALQAIACPSTTSCYAVGELSVSGAPGIAIVLSLASRASRRPTWVSDVVPADAAGTLDAIACPSSTSCYAVGSAVDSAAYRSRVVIISLLSARPPTWVSDVVPADAAGTLDAIACPSSTSCYAVGSLSGTLGTGNQTGAILSLSELGGNAMGGLSTRVHMPSGAYRLQVPAWTPDTVPPGLESLGAVACPSTTVCYAVGATPAGEGAIVSLASAPGSPLSGAIRPATWREDSISGTKVGGLDAIACPSTTTCYAAVGNVPLSFYWCTSGCGAPAILLSLSASSATEWTVDAVASGGEPMDVLACASPTTCYGAAGGSFDFYAYQPPVLLVSLSGPGMAGAPPSWQPDAVPSGIENLYDLTCPSPSVCFALGLTSTGLDILSLSSTAPATWVSDTLPPGTGYLDGIACPSTTTCYAVGTGAYDGAGMILSLSPRSSGTPTWVDDTVPSADANGFLSAIACGSPTSCYATGLDYSQYTASTSVIALSLSSPSQVSGTPTWVDDTVPSADASGFVEALTCPSPAACYASGTAGDSGNGMILSLAFPATSPPTWVADTVPNNTSALLPAVSCSGVGTCYVTETPDGVAGSTTILSLASPATSPPTWVADTVPSGADSLGAITCVSRGDCYAVGYGYRTRRVVGIGPAGGLIWSLSHSSPTRWSRDSAPSGVALLGVRCASATLCYATGYSLSSGPSVYSGAILSLVHGTSTRWSSDSIPAATGFALQAVCPSRALCLAIGAGSTASVGALVLATPPPG